MFKSRNTSEALTDSLNQPIRLNMSYLRGYLGVEKHLVVGILYGLPVF
jgi:hypothetical protein